MCGGLVDGLALSSMCGEWLFSSVLLWDFPALILFLFLFRYDNQTVFLASSQAVSAVLGTDANRRALYNFSVVLSLGDPSAPSGLAVPEVPGGFDPAGVAVGWAHGDDAEVTVCCDCVL